MSASLLAQESTGGAIARKGFGYQDAFMLQHIPLWLSQGAFSHAVSEAVGDIEVFYFAPGGKTKRVLYEAKDHRLTASEFWKEVADFKKAHDASPTEFLRFVLLCKEFNSETTPLVAMLGRLRGVGSAYDDGSSVLEGTREGITNWVQKKGQSAEMAEFVMNHVEFAPYSGEHATSAFAGEVEKHLPSINLRSNEIALFRSTCEQLIKGSSLGPVYRADIEEALMKTLGAGSADWLATPNDLLLEPTNVRAEDLGLVVGDFNGPDRSALTHQSWSELGAAAREVGNFIKGSRPRATIALSGKQRMSLSCLLGYAFSATRGFILDIDHNGHHYRTDDHAKAAGSFFKEEQRAGASGIQEAVVCIGFPTPVGADVDMGSGSTLNSLSRLDLTSTQAVDSMATLNTAVAEAKTALMRFRSEQKLIRVHLFLKAPSFFAMALGHRLNAAGLVQLYDWVDGKYLSTAVLGDTA
ncbi:hypothetical protein A3K87_24120 [Variovorax paradoxus]|uniref:SMODS-associated and fused to various effectors domain-containing protein n=1 Tax=Variovorax paradoxus TaxID=34073 RepID=A0AA91DKI0_VARPD|nr:dsDNA nuclease domain-containing protein [Variovorax paradoxus]OAK60206.1 hypothetical protein A3K87_24120 [Variovorax paradoxus]